MAAKNWLPGLLVAALCLATSFACATRPVVSGSVTVITQPGSHEIGRGIRLTFERPGGTDAPEWDAVLHWPAAGDRPACRHSFRLDDPGRGTSFAIAWERDAKELWVATAATPNRSGTLRRIGLADPARILEDQWGRNNNGGFRGLTDQVKRVLEKHFTIGRKDGTIGGNTGGQLEHSAQPEEEWIVLGTVNDANGRGLAGVPVEARTEYSYVTVVGAALTGPNGDYELRFRTDLRTLAEFRGVFVAPRFDGYAEQDLARNGEFTLLLRAGETPEHRFSRRDLVLGSPGRADFTLLDAGTVEGTVVGADGRPLGAHFVAIRTDDMRRGHSIASDTTDAQGRFRLPGIPGNRAVFLLVAASPAQEARAEPRRFEAGKTHRLRVVVDAEWRAIRLELAAADTQ